MTRVTFEQAQRLALLHARSIGAAPPLAAAAVGHRGVGCWVVEVGHPQWVTTHDMRYLNPDLPVFVVADEGTVEAYQLPIGPRFANLREVTGSPVDLDTALSQG